MELRIDTPITHLFAFKIEDMRLNRRIRANR